MLSPNIQQIELSFERDSEKLHTCIVPQAVPSLPFSQEIASLKTESD